MFIVDTNTAVGAVHNESAETEIDLVEVGPIRVRNIGALVSRSRTTGCLIGMNFLTALDSFEIRKDRLILRHGGRRDGIDIDLGGQPAAEASKSYGPNVGADHQPSPDEVVSPSPAGSVDRVPVTCPSCDRRMTLPGGRSGRVACVACGKAFHADTTQAADGRAATRSLDDGIGVRRGLAGLIDEFVFALAIGDDDFALVCKFLGDGNHGVLGIVDIAQPYRAQGLHVFAHDLAGALRHVAEEQITEIFGGALAYPVYTHTH